MAGRARPIIGFSNDWDCRLTTSNEQCYALKNKKKPPICLKCRSQILLSQSRMYSYCWPCLHKLELPEHLGIIVYSTHGEHAKQRKAHKQAIKEWEAWLLT